MSINTLVAERPVGGDLGGFLRECRARLKPDVDTGRRRTPGLRREEVAMRAGVSVTWYTWLEQGRGGPPSVEMLERIARALDLDAANRELLFLLGQQRPPPLTPTPPPAVPPTLQAVLDAMATSPAIVKTPTWDIVAWNAAATAMLADYAAMAPGERNVLRRIFISGSARDSLPDWEANARFAIGVFRIDVARAGGSREADALIEELRSASPDFRRLWAEGDVRSHGVGVKRLAHPGAGMVAFNYAGFPVDGADGLTMIVFTPVSARDRAIVCSVMEPQA